MRPPDQIPNLTQPEYRRGDLVYFWTGHAYSEKEVVTPHSFQSALTIKDGHGPLVVGPKDVISADAYKEEQREEARVRYDWIITHWNNGLRTSKEIAPLLTGMIVIGEPVSVRGCGQMIAAAKRWRLIESDKEPDAKPPID